MIDGWTIVAASLAYIGVLFLVAYFGDRLAKGRAHGNFRAIVYSLSLAVYCTSWTFFGSVGLSATTGYNFLPVYLGAMIMFALGGPLLIRVVRVAKNQNITSIADFIAARYGKSQILAATVTIIAVAGTLPYIALQLKAVSASVNTLLSAPHATTGGEAAPLASLASLGIVVDTAFIIAMTMAAFATLFGTRHVDATEHQHGLILAIAMESVVKLIAFLAVGIFVTFFMFDGFGDLWSRAQVSERTRQLFSAEAISFSWITVTLLSFVCIVLLPRQFHVTIVENNSEREIRRASWMFPLYLVAINIFVVPIAIAGLLTFQPGTVDADMFVVALPVWAGADWITMTAFIGGLSAATAMVIVALIALAIMVSNDLIIPLLLHRRAARSGESDEAEDLGPQLLNIRRFAIFAIMALAYMFHEAIGQSHALASIGLLSFSAIAQFAPAFFGGLVWRRGTALGAIAGIVAGFAMWGYTLLVPWFVHAGLLPTAILENGLFGLTSLRPHALFGIQTDQLTHGVFWSLAINCAVYVAVSLLRAPNPMEKLQANIFVQDGPVTANTPGVRPWRACVTVNDLQRTAARYVGAERASRSFAEFAARHERPLRQTEQADEDMLRFTEHLLASAIGAASSRLVLSLLMQKRHVDRRSTLKLLDDASEAIQYNRDLLHSALDQVGQGIAVFDADLRLICWNRQFRTLFNLPAELGRVGVPLDQILRHNADLGRLGQGNSDTIIADRLRKFAVDFSTFQERFADSGRILEVRTQPMPQGGIVTVLTDITERERAAEELARANETLERRVRERTAELTKVNHKLAEAKAKADSANLDKTRFLAAVSHDLLQPLNAARLYTSSLVEQNKIKGGGEIPKKIDASLEAVEDILSSLLDISRLDSGAMKADPRDMPIAEAFERMKTEFEPIAAAKGLRLRFADCSAFVRTDRRLLRRVLQNLISNAIKYTPNGGVLVGCRRRGDDLAIQVLDTGPGIERSKHALIFKEFQRLNEEASGAHGLGLGLSIVQRIANMLDHKITLTSVPGRGSTFSLLVPRLAPQRAVPAKRQAVSAGLQLAGCTTLCIDNEPDILESMRTLLTSWGCHVYTAVDAETALECIASNEARAAIDIVLADYHLDEGTGVDAALKLHQQLGRDIPVVIITADHSNEVQRDVRWRGFELLRKPLKPAALRAILSRTRLQRLAAE